ncbi:succinyl-diaminopimelate desuccinylase [Methylocapsa sp. S129]|uniref:succinyl-diaminopimelate desuccinylase n=1 Tax=Methylocapsa sp. S129 TaxID=1641869 RepID=UPI00131D504E|nr:succinyl-diaminopimelate desuccinylase [Methylocapsa sp. S129]
MSPPDAVEIARRLIARRSVTPADDGALPYLRGLLEAAGFAAEIVSFAEPGMATIDNLYARIGAESPHIVFAGHTDVVPTGDPNKWRFDPFSGEVAEGMVWGRGACDMKGGLAAAVAAALRVVDGGGLKGSISFLVTGDEEGPAVNGTVKLLEWARAKGELFDHCILGEPTSREKLGDMMKNGRRGSLTGRLTLLGKQGHVAYPHLARNPIRALAPILACLQAPALDAGTSSFEASNLEIISVDVGNGATNVIPGEVRLVFNVRFNDLWSPESLSGEIEKRIEGAAHGASYDLKFDSTNAVAFLTPSGAFTTLLSDAVEDIVGRRPVLSTSGGTSDARFIKTACPVVELGLVGQTMHGVDERASIEDIEMLARVYERALTLYFPAFARK